MLTNDNCVDRQVCCSAIRVWSLGQEEVLELGGKPLLADANVKREGIPAGFGELGMPFLRSYAKTSKSSKYSSMCYLPSCFSNGLLTDPFLQSRARKLRMKNQFLMRTILIWIVTKGKFF